MKLEDAFFVSFDIADALLGNKMMAYCRKTSLAKGELRRLSSSRRDNDWKLTAGRTVLKTRGGGQGRPVLQILDSSDDEEESNATEETSLTEEVVPEEEGVKKSVKPCNNRVLLELNQIDGVIGQLACADCGGKLQAIVRNVCLASSLGVECMNEECGFMIHPQAPAATTIHQARGDSFERSTDYAVNVLYVLGFLSMGDGCTEAARLLGLLGLPNGTTMKSRSFTIIEDRIGPIIRELCQETILENLNI
jgi:hypothetical protein